MLQQTESKTNIYEDTEVFVEGSFFAAHCICSRYINVTDGQTDRRMNDLRQQYRALHYVHRAVKHLERHPVHLACIKAVTTILVV